MDPITQPNLHLGHVGKNSCSEAVMRTYGSVNYTNHLVETGSDRVVCTCWLLAVQTYCSADTTGRTDSADSRSGWSLHATSSAVCVSAVDFYYSLQQ